MQLQSNIEWTQRDNLHSVPTDCDQRTERQGWMADASVSAEQAWHNFDMASFYRNWFRSIVDVQGDFPAKDPLDHRRCKQEGRPDCLGAVTDVVPYLHGTFGGRPADPSWSSAMNLMYWYLLRYAGDRRSAAEYYPALRQYVNYMLTIAAKDPTGLLQWHTTGDWLEQKYPTGSSNYHVPIRDNMTSAFNTILAIKILRDAAALLAKQDDFVKYGAKLIDQLQRWHSAYYNGTTYGDGSQAALSYTLFLDAPPTMAVRNASLANLVSQIMKDGMHPTTGIIATKWMPESLSKLGRSDVVLDMVLEPTAPSWMDQIGHNATTVWENWEYFVGPAMNSHNHPALTSVGAWFWRHLAGIRIPEDPSERGYAAGYSFVTLAPYSAIMSDHDRVSSVMANLPTVQGNVTLEWQYQDSGFRISATLPPNTAGEVLIPPPPSGSQWHSLSEGGVLVWQPSQSGVIMQEGLGVVRMLAGGSLAVNIGSGSYTFVADLTGISVI